MRLSSLFIIALSIGACGGEPVSADLVGSTEAACLHKKDLVLLSLGASTTNGMTFDIGPNLGQHHAANAHIPAFAAYLSQTTGRDVDVVNLSVPGQTSVDILATQLDSALDTLRHARKRTVITIEAGGNDMRAFAMTDEGMALCQPASPMFNQDACMARLDQVLDTAEANVATMLKAMRKVSHRVPIILMTQYNPYFRTGCAQAGFEQVAQGALEAPGFGLNVRLRALAERYGAAVADISGYLYQSGQYDNDAMFSLDCTHLAGIWSGIAEATIPGDETGLGYQALLGTFIAAYQSL